MSKAHGDRHDPQEQAMSERIIGFLDKVLRRYFGPEFGSCPRMRRADLERLLTDDAIRRLVRARQTAMDWGNSEIIGNVQITSERLLITPRGLLYAAALSGPVRGTRPPTPRLFHEPTDAAGLSASPHWSLYYLGTPRALFEPIVDRAAVTLLPPGSAAAVDSRLGRDLVFPWPLDTALRRTLDAHQVLRLDLTGQHRPTPSTGAQ